jgi:hypothetical protein
MEEDLGLGCSTCWLEGEAFLDTYRSVEEADVFKWHLPEMRMDRFYSNVSLRLYGKEMDKINCQPIN